MSYGWVMRSVRFNGIGRYTMLLPDIARALIQHISLVRRLIHFFQAIRPTSNPCLHNMFTRGFKRPIESKSSGKVYLRPPLFLVCFTANPLRSSFGGSFPPVVFFATSLHPLAPFAGLALFGTAVSISPLSARRFRRRNSSAKWRESIVEDTP